MMGSATAMLTGVAAAKATPSSQGDAAAGEPGPDFLAALDAEVPVQAAAAASAPHAPPARAAGTTAEDPAAADMAALIAGMLQALTTPAGNSGAATAEAGANAADEQPAATSSASGPVSQLPAVRATAVLAAAAAAAETAAGAGPAATTTSSPSTNTTVPVIAGTTPRSVQQPAAQPADPAVSDALAAGDAGIATQEAAAAAPRMDLRQLLQMMNPAQSATAGETDAPAGEPGAASKPPPPAPHPDSLAQLAGAAPVAIELVRRTADAATATPATDPAHAPDSTATEMPSPGPSPETLAAISASAAAPPHASPATSAQDATLHAAVGTPRWAEQLGSRLVLMSLHDQHEGSLNLTPEHLGPLEVRLSVNQGTADVWFGAQHADTRSALTEALPRLRELLAGAGLTLGQAGVSQQAPRQGTRGAEPPRIAPAAAAALDGVDSTARQAVRRIAIGLVDTYA